jgi:perosamine synthetase
MSRPLPAIPMPLAWADVWAACRAGADAREEFEEACRSYHGAAKAFAVSSGRVALWLALKASRRLMPNREEVLLPAYTCPTVGRAVVAARLRGRCVDVSPEDLNLSADRVAETLTERTLAVVAPHMFGTPCDVERLAYLCSATGTLLIEDVAQACGARANGRLAGTFGDLAFLSLGRSKNLRGAGGGVLLVNRADLLPAVSAEVEELPEGRRQFGAVGKQLAISALSRPSAWNVARRIPWLRVGAEDPDFDDQPLRLPAWRAGLGLRALERLEEFNARRARLGQLAEALLADVEGVHVQAKPPHVSSAYVRLALSVNGPRERRDRAVRTLQAQGIDAWGFYSRPIYGYDWWPRASDQRACPEAERIVDTNLVLPLYYAMTEEDVIRVVQCLGEGLRG